MANEISAVASLIFAKSGASAGIRATGTFTLTGNPHQKGEQSVGFAAAEVLNLGDVVPGGWCLLRNLDATNYVQVLTSTVGTAFARIKAGEFALFRLDAGLTAPAVRADTAAVRLEYLLLPD